MYYATHQLKEYPLSETLPEYILEKFHFARLNYSLRQVHFPDNIDTLRSAQNRLKFEELFYIQLSILRKRLKREQNSGGHIFSRIGDFFKYSP